MIAYFISHMTGPATLGLKLIMYNCHGSKYQWKRVYYYFACDVNSIIWARKTYCSSNIEASSIYPA